MNNNVDIKGIPETMLQTLYARAKETKSGRNYINDPIAAEIVSSIDYDFSNADKDKTMSSGVIARTILLDKMTEEFLIKNPGSIVVNIACGLDTRCYRLKGKYYKWYNLDLPETMNVRKRFLDESDSIKQLSFSAMDEAWANKIEDTDRPVLVIIEGLSMYLSLEAVRDIFNILERKFKSPRIFIEVMNPWIVKHVKEKSIEGSSARFSWGIKSGKELEALIPSFKSIQDRSLTEGMQVFMPIYKLIGKIGFVRNISNKILVLDKR